MAAIPCFASSKFSCDIALLRDASGFEGLPLTPVLRELPDQAIPHLACPTLLDFKFNPTATSPKLEQQDDDDHTVRLNEFPLLDVDALPGFLEAFETTPKSVDAVVGALDGRIRLRRVHDFRVITFRRDFARLADALVCAAKHLNILLAH